DLVDSALADCVLHSRPSTFGIHACSADSLVIPFPFFFQAEDGIRDRNVTGVQTCALPISRAGPARGAARCTPPRCPGWGPWPSEIGRASCRERVEIGGEASECRRRVEGCR